MQPYFFEFVASVAALLIALQWFFAWLKHRRVLNIVTAILIGFLWSIPIQFYWWGCGPCGQGALLIILLMPAAFILTVVPMLSRALAGKLWLNEKLPVRGDTSANA